MCGFVVLYQLVCYSLLPVRMSWHGSVEGACKQSSVASLHLLHSLFCCIHCIGILLYFAQLSRPGKYANYFSMATVYIIDGIHNSKCGLVDLTG